MTGFKPFAIVAAVVAALSAAAAPQAVTETEIARRLAALDPGHPRLFIRDFKSLELPRQTPAGTAYAGRIIHEADLILKYDVVAQKFDGDQMLDSCRNILYRINTLVLAYRLTGKTEYADKAVAEMRHAAVFPDWNPRHYLDTAELTLAIALGYDWLYARLTPADRELLENAIIEKGLRPSLAKNSLTWWVEGTNNWNQVCHAGMVAGALATYQRDPALAAAVISRAVNNLPRSMHASYYPRGAYPEGPVYWSYGSEFTVALLALLEGAFNTDFGLSEAPGFSQTGDFILAVKSPTGKSFSYADSGYAIGIDLAQVWLARRFARPDWIPARSQRELLNMGDRRSSDVSRGGNRMMPLAMLFFTDYAAGAKDAPKFYFSGADAAVPVAMFRTGWDENDAFLGVKAGSPSWAHGHMDAGSFVYDAAGVRWAADLGQDNYGKFLARKMTLWNYEPGSDRWKIFRFGPASHNILRIDGQLQIPTAKAEIIECTESAATVDLSAIYQNSARQVNRIFRLNPDRSLEITDQIDGVKPGATLRWQMLIQKSAAVIDGNTLHLTNNGRALDLTVTSPVPGKWSVTPAKAFEAEWDAANPDCQVIAYEQAAPADGKLTYHVRLLPVAAAAVKADTVVSLGSAAQPSADRILLDRKLDRGFSFSCQITPLEPVLGETAWKSTGIGIHQNSENQFLLSFCESPAASGRRHFLEFKQRKNNRWGAVDGIKAGEYRANFNWQYGQTYLLTVNSTAKELTAQLSTPDHTPLATIPIPVTSPDAIQSGNPILFSSGIKTDFTAITCKP